MKSNLQLFDLTGKTALVTGASSGFGWHFSKVLAGAGARVLVGARRTERLEHLCAEIGSNGGLAYPVSLDVTDEVSIKHAFATAEAAWAQLISWLTMPASVGPDCCSI